MPVVAPASVAHAVEPGEMLKDPALEARARRISGELRCPVCQNQSIDDSNAPLSRDLRLLVRERLVAGDSDRAVIDYIVARYGEFVLLRPPVGWHTLLLWLAPLVMLAGAAFYIGWRLRGRSAGSTSELSDDAAAATAGATAALSPEEEARLARLLAEKPGNSA
ncbi:MAG: cytochrome c-type biogenesis protein [Hyphomicrobiaceae bacterium]